MPFECPAIHSSPGPSDEEMSTEANDRGGSSAATSQRVTPSHSEPALCQAAAAGDLAEVTRLLQSNARIDERNANVETALWLSCRWGHPNVTAALLQSGAMVDAINLLGETPLFAACAHGHATNVLLLVEKQATLDYPANQGMTPLMAAANAGCMEAVITLIEKGASVGLTSEDGKSALDWANEAGHDVISQYLEFHDVKMTRTFSTLTPHTKSSMGSFSTVMSDRSPVLSPRRRRPSDSSTVPLEEMLRCIRKTALQCAPEALRPQHFSQQDATRLTVRLKEGGDLRMKEFLPKVHAKIRELCGVDGALYAEAWDLPPDQLQLTTGAGRSGSLFAHSVDKRYILKTIPLDEVMTYVERAQSYYHHLRDHPDALIMRIYGLYRFQYGWGTSHLLISGNVLFCHSPRLDTSLLKLNIFDLKGRVPKPGKLFQRRSETDTVWKDKDLERFFWLTEADRIHFLRQLHKDIDWLQTQNMMDYSLLIGVRELPAGQQWEEEAEITAEEHKGCAFRRHIGGLRAPSNEIYYIGIIDCLTNYSGKKVVANLCKSFLWKGNQLSTVPSETYAARFYAFMEAIFPPEERHEDPSLAVGHPNAPYALRDGFKLTELFLSRASPDGTPK